VSLVFAAHPEASAELDAEVAWYEARDIGLGARFESVVYRLIDDLLTWPESGAIWTDAHPTLIVRSYGVPEFPHRVVYAVSGTQLFVVAIAHNKRKPGYWRDRLNSPFPPPAGH